MFRRSSSEPDSARVRFDALLRTHHPPLRAHVRVVYPSAEVDAVVNAIFTRLWLRLDDVPDHAVRSWLRAAARHEVLNGARSERRRRALHDKVAMLDTSRAVGPPDADVRAELDLVMQAMATLTSADREVLLMTALEDLSTDELADILGVGPSAAKTRLSRARTRLRTAVEHMERARVEGTDR